MKPLRGGSCHNRSEEGGSDHDGQRKQEGAKERAATKSRRIAAKKSTDADELRPKDDLPTPQMPPICSNHSASAIAKGRSLLRRWLKLSW